MLYFAFFLVDEVHVIMNWLMGVTAQKNNNTRTVDVIVHAFDHTVCMFVYEDTGHRSHDWRHLAASACGSTGTIHSAAGAISVVHDVYDDLIPPSWTHGAGDPFS
jgi:hypothetical protein